MIEDLKALIVNLYEVTLENAFKVDDLKQRLMDLTLMVGKV